MPDQTRQHSFTEDEDALPEGEGVEYGKSRGIIVVPTHARGRAAAAAAESTLARESAIVQKIVHRIVIPTHKLGRFFLCVCCVLVRCVWVFAGCVCVLGT